MPLSTPLSPDPDENKNTLTDNELARMGDFKVEASLPMTGSLDSKTVDFDGYLYRATAYDAFGSTVFNVTPVYPHLSSDALRVGFWSEFKDGALVRSNVGLSDIQQFLGLCVSGKPV